MAPAVTESKLAMDTPRKLDRFKNTEPKTPLDLQNRYKSRVFYGNKHTVDQIIHGRSDDVAYENLLEVLKVYDIDEAFKLINDNRPGEQEKLSEMALAGRFRAALGFVGFILRPMVQTETLTRQIDEARAANKFGPLPMSWKPTGCLGLSEPRSKSSPSSSSSSSPSPSRSSLMARKRAHKVRQISRPPKKFNRQQHNEENSSSRGQDIERDVQTLRQQLASVLKPTRDDLEKKLAEKQQRGESRSMVELLELKRMQDTIVATNQKIRQLTNIGLAK